MSTRCAMKSRGLLVMLAILGTGVTGCKKTHMKAQAVVPATPATASTDLAAAKDDDLNPGDGKHRLKPTYELLSALREQPLKILASSFDIGLSDEEVDQIADNPEQQTISVASADGNLIIIVENGMVAGVDLSTSVAVPATGPADEP